MIEPGDVLRRHRSNDLGRKCELCGWMWPCDAAQLATQQNHFVAAAHFARRIFAGYALLHLAKHTPEGNKKAADNGEISKRFEILLKEGEWR